MVELWLDDGWMMFLLLLLLSNHNPTIVHPTIVFHYDCSYFISFWYSGFCWLGWGSSCVDIHGDTSSKLKLEPRKGRSWSSATGKLEPGHPGALEQYFDATFYWLVVTGTWLLFFRILGITIPADWYFSSLSPSPFLLTSCGPKKRSSILRHKNSTCLLHQGEPNNFNNVAEKARSMTSHTSVSRQLGWNTRAVEKDHMVWLVNLVAYVDGAPSSLSLWSYGRTSYHIAYIM